MGRPRLFSGPRIQRDSGPRCLNAPQLRTQAPVPLQARQAGSRGWVHELGARGRRSPAALNRDLAGARSAAELLALCQRAGEDLDALHVVTALHRVAKLSDGRAASQGEGWHSLASRVAEMESEPEPRHLAGLARPMAKSR